MRIDFVSDVACPWCAVGLNSLETALKNIGDAIPVELHIEPFELNPSMPPEGEDAIRYISRKYGAPPEQLAQRAPSCASAAPRSASSSASGPGSGTPSTRIACCTGPGSRARTSSGP